jgi:Hydrogenase maturation factor
MKLGKVAESVLIRSVLREITVKREEVLVGPNVGEDCAALKLAKDEVFVISTDPITGTISDIGELAIHVTANDLAASGAEPVGVMLTILLPPNAYESDIKKIMEQVENACKELNIQVLGGHTEVTEAVNQPLLSVTGVGKVKEGKMILTSGAKSGQDIVLTKWIALEGTSIIAKEKEELLLRKYPKEIVAEGKSYSDYLSIIPEAKIAAVHGVTSMHDVTEGGIFGALWEMAQSASVGIEVDLRAIPVKQVTIEICEAFGLNPYMLISSGALLMTTDKGVDLVRELREVGIQGTIIGKVTNKNERIIRNGEEVRYLDRPQTDELYKLNK